MAKNGVSDTNELAAAIRRQEEASARLVGAYRLIIEAVTGEPPPPAFDLEPELMARRIRDMREQRDQAVAVLGKRSMEDNRLEASLRSIANICRGPANASPEWVVDAVEAMHDSLLERTRALKSAHKRITELQDKSIPPGGTSWRTPR